MSVGTAPDADAGTVEHLLYLIPDTAALRDQRPRMAADAAQVTELQGGNGRRAFEAVLTPAGCSPVRSGTVRYKSESRRALQHGVGDMRRYGTTRHAPRRHRP